MSGVVSFFASGPQGQQGRGGLLTLRGGSRCERAQHGPRSACPSPTPGPAVRRTSLAALAPRAGVPPWGGSPRAAATGPDRSRTDSLVQSARWPPYWRGSDRLHPARCRVLLAVRALRRSGGSRGFFCGGWRVEGAQTEVPPLRGKPQSRVGHRRVTQGGTT